MLKTTLKIVLALALACVLAPATAVELDFAEDVQFDADPSPATGVSGINDYTQQDEQINLNENSGTVRVLRTDQKALINQYVTDIIELKHTNPRELRTLARTITRKEGGDADVLNDKVGNKSYLVVVAPEWQIPYLRRTLQAIDQEWTRGDLDGAWTYYYRAQHREVSKILNILKIYRTPDASFVVDDSANALLFDDQPCIQGLVQWGLKTVDIPPNEVTLDVAIYEVTTQNDLAIGFDFESWKNGPGRALFNWIWYDNDVDPLNVSPVRATPSGALNHGRFYSYDFQITSAYIDFLHAKGQARLLTRAHLTAKSGATDAAGAPIVAELAAVDQVAGFVSEAGINSEDLDITDRYPDADIPPGVAPQIVLQTFQDRTLEYVRQGQVGVVFQAFPVVGAEAAETALSISVSDVTGLLANGQPVIENRSYASVLELHRDQPIVLAGMKRKSRVQHANGVPFLRDIPLLGYAFGREVGLTRQTEIVVFVIPHFNLCLTCETAPPEQLQTAVKLASGEEVLEVPSNSWGFDQWLLDSETTYAEFDPLTF